MQVLMFIMLCSVWFSYVYLVRCVQPLWRLTQAPPDDRLLVYRSEDIRNVSRLAAPKVCGYITAEASQLLPEHVRPATAAEEKEEVEGERFRV